MVGRFVIGIFFLLGIFFTNSVNAQGVTDTSKMSFQFVEQMPDFPGGQDAMIEYIRTNLRYPKQARRAKISGKVLVHFVIDENGNVTEEKVIEGIGGGCDEEALSVVHHMPRWKPAKQNGAFVKTQYTLPFIFNL